MSKTEWQQHMAAQGQHDTKACDQCAQRRTTRRASLRAKERADVMRSLGLTKVRGGWE